MNTSDTEISKRVFPHHAGGNRFLKFLQFATVLLSTSSATSFAVLLDHGPSDPQLTWPQWYRDTNGLALGLCKSQELSPNAAAGNAPMCFPPAPDPLGFAGNFGPEMFYNMVEFREKNTGSDFRFRYVAGLEASYLPVGLPVHGTELVFARVRIALNFNTTAKNGTYVVTHPFGVEVFNNVKATNNQNLFGANAAVFFTSDVPLGPEMNFDGALGGALGPFIGWDVLEPGESLTVNGTTFLGDPNYAHTFTGSPYGTNYIRIQGPSGSNLDGLGNDFIQVNVANVLGQVWGAPIAQPLAINDAYKSRSAGAGGVNSIDVWASSSPNQKLILTGTGMPSLQLFPDGVVPGKYHGHIEYPSSQAVPASVMVTNVDSNPVVSQAAALKDGVEISTASFNTNTGDITVVAASSDKVGLPTLVVQGIPGIDPAASTVMTAPQCLQTGLTTKPDDVCYVYKLPAGIEPPESISVASSDLGAHAEILLAIVGNPQNKPNPPVASDFIGANGFTVSTNGSSALVNTAGNSLPTDALIVRPPTTGNIALIGGAWTYTAATGAVAGTDNFQFVRQDPITLAVSNVAVGNLTLEFQSAAPTANLDQFAALANNLNVVSLRVLGNDKPATANPADQLNPASVVIVTQPTRGTATVNTADGTISYKGTTGGGDSLTYQVSNNAGQVSNVATVQLTNFTGAESVNAGKVNYTISQAKWVIVGGTNWFGPNLTQTTATCWNSTDPAPTASTLIGSALIDTTGKFQLALLGGPVGVNNQRITCQTSNGGKGVGTTSAK